MTTQNSVDNNALPMPYLPQRSLAYYLQAFCETVYNPVPTSHIYKFLSALIGSSGAGELKQRILKARMALSPDCIEFSDLDKLYMSSLGFPRLPSESYATDPENGLLTSDEWDEVKTKDSAYRARCKDFATACNEGGTPDGFRMACMAALGVDADLFEVWRYIDLYGLQSLPVTVLIPTTNLCTNPSVENGTTGFSVGANSTISQTSLVSLFGSHSLLWRRSNTTAGNGNTSFTFTGAANTVYTCSVFANLVAGDGSGYSVTVTGNVNSSLLHYSSVPVLNNGWTRLFTTFVTNSTGGSVNFFFSDNLKTTGVATGNEVALDGWQIEAQYQPTPYCDGSLGTGYTWNGTPNNSTSTRSANTNSAGTPGRIGIPMRNEVVIKPHVQSQLSPRDFYDLRKCIYRIKPADCIPTIDVNGLEVEIPITPKSVGASSSYFQIIETVTGVPNLASLPAPGLLPQDVQASEYWIQVGQGKEAPKISNSETQEYSLYYLYNKSGNSDIDNITYYSEVDGITSAENNYVEFLSPVTKWGPWHNYPLADSPDNFPGGKYGLTPTKAPAKTSSGTTYSFPYSSQEEYVQLQIANIVADGGQANTSQYRTPLVTSANSSSVKAWLPTNAVPLTAPPVESTVVAKTVQRPLSSQQIKANNTTSLFAGG